MSTPPHDDDPGRRVPEEDATTSAAGSPRRGRRRILLVILLAVVIVIGLIIAWTLVRPGAAEPAVTSTTTAAAPTAQADPIDHDDTEFSAAQPDTVLDYALTELTEADAPAAAVEAWQLVYSGDDDIDVTATQWSTPDEAEDGYDRAVDEAEGKPDSLGEVTVDQDVTGEAVLVTPADDTPAEEARLIWRNGTAVLEISGAAAELEPVFRAYPM